MSNFTPPTLQERLAWAKNVLTEKGIPYDDFKWDYQILEAACQLQIEVRPQDPKNPFRLLAHDELTGHGDECYSVLLGPDGTEYWLTEPEDRTWYRDLSTVKDLLNKQHLRIKELEEEAQGYELYLASIANGKPW